ncbi:putative ribonuclease H-like domain-containing protein, partial [Tanacetum coccineum]
MSLSSSCYRRDSCKYTLVINTRKCLCSLSLNDETSGILKSFITRVENLIDQRVKVIRCDNGTDFKNKEMNQFCKRKGIKREFSVAKTPQQNRVAKRKNRTLIEASRTMLDNSKLPTTFWVEVLNTACYVQNRVLVTKPHNKTPYEIFLGRNPALGFMRPFGCPVTILNTIDHLGKFDGKADEGLFVGYSINSKAFRVFNSRTRIVEENLLVQFSENTPNIAGSTKAYDDEGKARMETVSGKDYILLPLWPVDLPFSQNSKSSHDARFKPSRDNEKNVTEEPRKKGGDSNDDEDVGAEADMNNLNTFMPVSPIPTTRIHKHHPVEQIIGDLNLAPQTRRITKNLEEHDDIIFGSTKKSLCTEFKKMMHKKFQMSSIGELTFFLGLQVKQKEDGIFISQDKYMTEILKKFSFSDVKTTSTPMETQKPLLKDVDGEEVNVHLYRSMIGSLMYLTSSRPDIMFTVCACVRYQVNLKMSHRHVVKRIFRYLKGQPKLGLWYLKDSPFEMVVYTNSDYAKASLDRKSTTRGTDISKYHKKPVKNGQARTRESEEYKKKLKNQSRSQKSQASVKS